MALGVEGVVVGKRYIRGKRLYPNLPLFDPDFIPFELLDCNGLYPGDQQRYKKDFLPIGDMVKCDILGREISGWQYDFPVDYVCCRDAFKEGEKNLCDCPECKVIKHDTKVDSSEHDYIDCHDQHLNVLPFRISTTKHAILMSFGKVTEKQVRKRKRQYIASQGRRI